MSHNAQLYPKLRLANSSASTSRFRPPPSWLSTGTAASFYSVVSSRRAQRGPAFEVILVDNGSTDDSVEMATSRYSRDPAFALTIVRNRENFGFCKANNQGMDSRAQNSWRC